MAAASVNTHTDLLNQALELANKELQGRKVTGHFSNPDNGKSPVFLSLIENKHSKTLTPIGAIHVVHLKGSNWDAIPYSDLVKNVKDIVFAILDAVNARESLIEDNNVIITERGVPFFTNGNNVKIKNDLLIVNERPVTYNGKNISAKCIVGEGGCYFTVNDDDTTLEISDNVDKRGGKIFINLNSNELYRA